MKDIERMGLLKMDFLGLSTLTLIDDALNEIKRTEHLDLDIDNLPLDDAATFKVFSEAATYGVFQFESAGMRRMLKEGGPRPEGRWADLGLLEPVKYYPHRHASTLLVFDAVERALDEIAARRPQASAAQ